MKIEWTDVTWNPIRGCSRVSEGCRNCYAEHIAARFSRPDRPGLNVPIIKGLPFQGVATMTKDGPRWTGEVRFIEDKLDAPLHWKKPRRVFVNSMSDLFHEKVPSEWIDRIFRVMGQAPHHTFQILTKRPQRMLEQMTRLGGGLNPWFLAYQKVWPWPNVWIGVSVENQATADERIPFLLQTPATVRWVSYEPALGPVDLHDALWRTTRLPTDEYESIPREPKLDWVVIGGESGPGARPCDRRWIYNILDQCRQAGVSAFVKQLGAKSHIDGTMNFLTLKDKKGGDPSEWPEDLRVREFPG